MSLPLDYRLQLNNLLQANGGVDRLRWGEPIRGGPNHNPSWTISGFFDGNDYGHATAKTVDLAKEELARRILMHLLAPNVA